MPAWLWLCNPQLHRQGEVVCDSISVCRSDAFSSKEDRAIPPPIENLRLVVSLPNEMLCDLFDAVWSIPKEPIRKTVLTDYQSIIFTYIDRIFGVIFPPIHCYFWQI